MRRSALCIVTLLAMPIARAQAQPVASGGEILVNTYTTGVQWDPSVASDGAGNFVVVWSEADERTIRAQRYDATGAAQGTEFQVSEAGAVTSAPSVAMSVDGSFVVAWLDTEPKIAARAYDAGGVPQGTAFRVDTTIFDYVHGYPLADQDKKSAPEIAGDGDGQFTVVWAGGYNQYMYFLHQRRMILGQRVDGSGALVGTEFRVQGASYYRKGLPDVAADAQGEFVVAWTEVTDYMYYYDGPFYLRSPNYLVRARRLDAAAAAVTDIFDVGTDGRLGPRVGTEPGGQFIVAWAHTETPEGSQVFARRYDETATALGTEFLVSTPPTSPSGQVDAGASGVDVTLAADGRSVVAWSSGAAGFEGSTDGSATGLFARSFAANGTPISTEVAVNAYTTSDQKFPALARTGSDTFVAAWGSDGQDGSASAVIARRFGHDECACGACQIGECPDQPCSGCLTAGKTSLQVRNDAQPTKHRITWKWLKGEGFAQEVLGDPISETTYTLCIYDSIAGAPVRATALSVPPGVLWTNASPNGFQYKDSTGSSEGVVKLALRTGAAGKSKAQLVARAGNIPMPTPISESELFDQNPDVTVQLHTHGGACWTSELVAAGTRANTATHFKATAP